MNVSSVVAFLEKKGRYRIVHEPLHVADFSFEFDAVLRGPGDGSGLVVVLDGQEVPLGPLRRRLAAFRTVLERKGKNRSVTAVLLSPGPSSEDLDALASICRVITIENDAEIANELRALLPLALPAPMRTTATGWEALEERLAARVPSPLTASLLRAGRRDPEAVQKVLRTTIDNACSEAVKELEEIL